MIDGKVDNYGYDDPPLAPRRRKRRGRRYAAPVAIIAGAVVASTAIARAEVSVLDVMTDIVARILPTASRAEATAPEIVLDTLINEVAKPDQALGDVDPTLPMADPALDPAIDSLRPVDDQLIPPPTMANPSMSSSALGSTLSAMKDGANAIGDAASTVGTVAANAGKVANATQQVASTASSIAGAAAAVEAAKSAPSNIVLGTGSWIGGMVPDIGSGSGKSTTSSSGSGMLRNGGRSGRSAKSSTRQSVQPQQTFTAPPPQSAPTYVAPPPASAPPPPQVEWVEQDPQTQPVRSARADTKSERFAKARPNETVIEQTVPQRTEPAIADMAEDPRRSDWADNDQNDQFAARKTMTDASQPEPLGELGYAEPISQSPPPLYTDPALQSLEPLTTGLAPRTADTASTFKQAQPLPPPPPPPPEFKRGGKYYAQLFATQDEQATCDAWARLKGAVPNLLENAEKSVLKQGDGNAALYKLRAGAFDNRKEARRFCDTVKKKGYSCFVTER